MIEIRAHVDSAEQMKRWSRHHSRAVRTAVSRSMNDAGRKGRTRLLRALAEETGLKYGVVRAQRALKHIYATPDKLFFAVYYKHRVPFVEYQKGRKYFSQKGDGRLTFTSYGNKRKSIGKAFRFGGARAGQKNLRFYLRDRDGGIRAIFGGSLKARKRPELDNLLTGDFSRRLVHHLKRAGYKSRAIRGLLRG